jgi:hypothetical protein
MGLRTNVVLVVLACVVSMSVGQSCTGCNNTFCSAGLPSSPPGNCQYSCSCTPSAAPVCKPADCGKTLKKPSGCGGPDLSTKCPDCCPTSCNTTIKTSTGSTVTLPGMCATTQPANTIPGDPCPTGCGICYVNSFNTQLCPATPNGPCSAKGRCGCFGTKKGGSCQASNFLNPQPSPLPGNGGGCQENLCNALAAKNGLNAACCPSGC